MKVSAVAKEYGLDDMALYKFVTDPANGIDHKLKLTDAVVDDDDVADIVQAFQTGQGFRVKERAAFAAESAAEDQMIRDMPITASHSFEGYRIVRYGGYISGDEVIPMEMDWFSGKSEKMVQRLKDVRQVAIRELKEAAFNIGCNAVIALDFDYINFETHSVFNDKTNVFLGLTANGTAVEIEKA